MFADSFNVVNIESVVKMTGMFRNTKSLISRLMIGIHLGHGNESDIHAGKVFDQDISDWNVSSVSDFEDAFFDSGFHVGLQ